jgi:riboflavin biosynthesis pyrimidine reductase
VILDGRLRSAPRAKVYRPGHLVFSAVRPRPADRRSIEVLTAKGGRLSLSRVLRRLAELGVVHLMVEGGAEVLSEFIETGLWDELYLFVAPKLAGPDGISWFGGRSARRMQDALVLGTTRMGRAPRPDGLLIIERGVRGPV